jgi:glycosyltransferase involved in cell wall biosynthesis
VIYTVLPTGSFHGWGVCGKYIVKELSRLDGVRLLTEGLEFQNIQDEFDYRLLRSVEVSEQEAAAIRSGVVSSLPWPLLQNIVDKTMRPAIPGLRGTRTVGYTFFEENILAPSFIETGKRCYDLVVAGSTWCEDVLRQHGLTNVSTIIQGVDPTIFNATHATKEYLEEKFVLFSGGKFELRKGQDLVLKAFKVLHDRYPDVILITSWYNHWAASMQTMCASPHIRFTPESGDYQTLMRKTLVGNGINPDRVITLPPYPNIMMTRMYRNTDIGIFPNRCEGGTNLVMMEYMACGKPVVASYNTGHRDVLSTGNSLMVTQMRPLSISANGQAVATWEEPNLDEIVANLDWAYHHREEARNIGARAASDMVGLTWGRTARMFHAALSGAQIKGAVNMERSTR